MTPTCEKCGAEISTGLMAVFCPRGQDCQFWEPDLDESIREFQDLFRESKP